MNILPEKPLRRVIPAADAAAWIDGYAFLDRAREQSEVIRAAADAEVQNAVAAGMAQGRYKGEAEAASTLLQTQSKIEDWLKTMEPAIVDMVSGILHEILADLSDEEAVIRATRRALATMRDRQTVTLSIAPALFAAVNDQLGTIPGLRIVADRHLEGRQCLLSTPDSSIDITIDTQLDTIITAMNDASGHIGTKNG